MKTLRFFNSIPGVALATGLFLLVPFIVMQFTNEINWGAVDFILAGSLIFFTGTLLVLALKLKSDIVYRIAFFVAIMTTFFMIWANIAVGLIGSGPNPGNLMYIGVIVVLFGGVYFSKYKSSGLELAMFATAFSLVLLAIIALLSKMHQYPGSSVLEIILVNLFFSGLFIVSGLLFRSVTFKHNISE
jgi:hypothetical protein